MLPGKSLQEKEPICCIGCSVGLNKGIRYEGTFHGEGDDPWIEFRFEEPVSYVVLSLTVPGGYCGDAFTAYFAAVGDEYAQEFTWAPSDWSKPGLARLFTFDGPIAKLRLDICEAPGDTGIVSMTVGGFGDRHSADRLWRRIHGRGRVVDDACILVSRRSALERYADWFSAYRVSEGELDRQRATRFGIEPLISIIVPVYNTELAYFEAMVESVLSQSYARWELVLANSTPDNKALCRLISSYVDHDKRVRVVNLECNHGISENTNRGVAAARGEYIGFLDHDDFIEPDLLFRYVEAINGRGKVDALYCDEDKYSFEGLFVDPRFKPDFNRTLLRNNNYICHLFMIRKALLDQIGPLPSQFDGAQDHWLILRASEITDGFVHVPRILYHWRLTSSSTAGDGANKPYACRAGIAAVEDHCARMGLDAEVSSYQREFTYRLAIPIVGHPSVAVVVPCFSGVAGLPEALASLLPKSETVELEVVLLGEDKAAMRTTAGCLRALRPDIRVLREMGVGRGERPIRSVKRILSCIDADYLVFVPSGFCGSEGDWIAPLLMQAQQPQVGFVGARIILPSGCGDVLWSLPDGVGVDAVSDDMAETGMPACWFFSPEDTMEVAAPGPCFMVSRKKLEDLVRGIIVWIPKRDALSDLFRSAQRKGLANVYAADSVLRVEEGSKEALGPSWSSRAKRVRYRDNGGSGGFLNANLSSLLSHRGRR